MAPLIHLETELRIPIVLFPNNPLVDKSLIILEEASNALSQDINFFQSRTYTGMRIVLLVLLLFLRHTTARS